MDIEKLGKKQGDSEKNGMSSKKRETVNYLGIPNSFDHQRMLKSARVCKVKGINTSASETKMANDIYDMFHTRYTLYHQAYKHKIVTIV
ncbi:hypothetical protein QQF64_000289 [Cirrhinus molitorella]|uniref:Uncharacterized protein n=1 Tax=Cirrhinus molitorella TaxID=172907 RepID=A0ABR3NWV9_9TELE